MRYFLVHYIAKTVDNTQMVGLSEVVTGENFINRKKFIQEVMDTSLEKGVALAEVMPTQIMELSESDYMDWYE